MRTFGSMLNEGELGVHPPGALGVAFLISKAEFIDAAARILTGHRHLKK